MSACRSLPGRIQWLCVAAAVQTLPAPGPAPPAATHLGMNTCCAPAISAASALLSPPMWQRGAMCR